MANWIEWLPTIIAAFIALISWYYYRRQTEILLKNFRKPKIVEVVRRALSVLIERIKEQYLKNFNFKEFAEINVREIINPEVKSEEARNILYDALKILIDRYDNCWDEFEGKYKKINEGIEEYNKIRNKEIIPKLEMIFKDDPEIQAIKGNCHDLEERLAKDFLSQPHLFKDKSANSCPFYHSWAALCRGKALNIDRNLGNEKTEEKFEEAKRVIENELKKLREYENAISVKAREFIKRLEDVREKVKKEYELTPTEASPVKEKVDSHVEFRD
jgi:hypothetical protein